MSAIIVCFSSTVARERTKSRVGRLGRKVRCIGSFKFRNRLEAILIQLTLQCLGRFRGDTAGGRESALSLHHHCKCEGRHGYQTAASQHRNQQTASEAEYQGKYSRKADDERCQPQHSPPLSAGGQS